MLDEQEKMILRRLVEESLKEKRSKRRWGIFFKLSIVGLIFIAVVLYSGTTQKTGGLGDKLVEHVALVKLEGIIFSESEAGSEIINEKLREAFQNEKSKAVILQINTPGGSAVQSSRINREIVRLRESHKDKPIYTVVEDVCASGGMFVAVATDAIYADRASIIGSIGVISSGFGLEDLISKIGVKRRLITAGEHKAMLDPFVAEKSEEVAHVQGLLNEIHEYFIQAVEEGRGDKLSKDRERLYSGLVWTGEESKELGLIDGFGDASYVAREIVKVDNLVEYETSRNVFDYLESISSDILVRASEKLLASQSGLMHYKN